MTKTWRSVDKLLDNQVVECNLHHATLEIESICSKLNLFAKIKFNTSLSHINWLHAGNHKKKQFSFQVGEATSRFKVNFGMCGRFIYIMIM